MSIYERTTKELMHDFARERLAPGQSFKKKDAIDWFREKYPKIRPTTVGMHVEGMSVNAMSRKHHLSVKPNADWDLFFKIGSGLYRLWDQATDPSPIYRDDILKSENAGDGLDDAGDSDSDDEETAGGAEFAFEKDLRNYLSVNLDVLEHGLRLYQDEDQAFTGIEFPVGGRFIDILAVDRTGGFVVIELKVSRGYDRAVGQLLRYMAWISRNVASGKSVRGVIVASEITEDLKLAASLVPNVSLWSYRIAFQLQPVQVD